MLQSCGWLIIAKKCITYHNHRILGDNNRKMKLPFLHPEIFGYYSICRYSNIAGKQREMINT
jgi:hypothetical protein